MVTVDNIGTAIAAGDLCLLSGVVRHIDDGVLVIVTADGKQAFRVKASDTRKLETVVNPSTVDAKADANANLSAIASLSTAADKFAYFTGSGSASTGTITSFGRSLVDDADAAAARSTLGLGSLATQSVRSLDVCLQSIYATGAPWSAMPSAHTLAFNNIATVRRIDLTQYTQCRLKVVQSAAAASGAKLRLRYATSSSTSASGYSAIGSGATEVDVSLSTSTNQFLESSWFDLESAAKANVYVACTGISGNGATSPSFFSIDAEFR